jgi:hypothetical protein
MQLPLGVLVLNFVTVLPTALAQIDADTLYKRVLPVALLLLPDNALEFLVCFSCLLFNPRNLIFPPALACRPTSKPTTTSPNQTSVEAARARRSIC